MTVKYCVYNVIKRIKCKESNGNFYHFRNIKKKNQKLETFWFCMFHSFIILCQIYFDCSFSIYLSK